MACCQDIGESAAGLRDPERTTPPGHGGFVEYYRGYAWLKMPLHDDKNSIDLAPAAQIYFPSEQIPELTAILTDLSGIVSVDHPDQRVAI